MDAGANQRLRIAGAVGVLGLLCAAVLASEVRPAGAAPPAPELLPDLTVPPARETLVERRGERRILRFSHTTVNRGDGPLEISPDLSTTTCSEGGGDGREAYQYIFHDTNGSGQFERADDGPPEGRPVGCMIFHAPHDHYHFRDFALYELYRERTGALMETSDKVSFCVFDLRPVASMPGTPAFYDFSNCEKDDGTHGISIGWADVYGARTAGQELNVTGMPRGRYCLVSIADPEDRLHELEPGGEANNVRRLKIALRPGRAFVRRLDEPCRTSRP